MRKKIILLITVFLVAVMTRMVYSYLSDQVQKQNKMSIGENTIIPEESFQPGDFVPGSVFVKAPSLKNTGNVICYVRMMVECSRSDMESLIEMNWNTSDWTEKKDDGYYYYKRKLYPEETSVPIFTQVSISNNIREEELKDFNIIVYGESIQAGEFDNYEKAWEQSAYANMGE